MPSIAAIVQARMSSARFPGKVLTPLRGHPLVVYLLKRLATSKKLDSVILATSEMTDDDPLAAAVEAAGFRVFRGSLDDVLGRFASAARSVHADIAVRITGDCPLIDVETLDRMIDTFVRENVDYLSNVSPPTYPDGLDVEIVRTKALEAAEAEARPGHQREHVTPFIRENPGRFPSLNYRNDVADESAHHWSIDTRDDLALVSALVDKTEKDFPSLADLRRVIASDPELARRSTMTSRNEGSIKTMLEDLERRWPRPNIEESNRIWERARTLVPAGTQTLSKGPNQFCDGFGPKYLARGKGSHVWDVDGNEYIDYPMGLGAVSLGHANPEVIAAVTEQLASGNTYSMMHPLEVEVSERIVSMVPCAERVRFGKNGSDATSACIRAARAKTGRTHVARCGYHGWQDWSVDQTYGIRSRGVPAEVQALTHAFPYNDLEALEKLLQSVECAAVILEPVAAVVPKPGYLEGVRELATRYGAVLVFDEVITGFRHARGGAQEHFKVTPDLCSMGKGVGNGFPLSIVCGTKEFMEPFEEIFFSFTFGGETAALAAAKTVLSIMERENYWAHVWKHGATLQNSFKALAKEFQLDSFADCVGLPPWTVTTFTDHDGWTSIQLKTLFQQEMLRHRILFSGSQFISLAHDDTDIERTVSAYREAMRVVRFALDSKNVTGMTLGKTNELVFRRA